MSRTNYSIRLTENVERNARTLELICTPRILESLERAQNTGGFKRFSVDVVDCDGRPMTDADQTGLSAFLSGVLA
jgi:hypothetical protein